MWGFLLAVAVAVGLGVLAALPFATYLRWTVPTLARVPARPAAYLLAAIPALLAFGVTVAFVAGWLNFMSPVVGRALVLVLTLATIWQPIVHAAVRMTGGPASAGMEDELLRVEAASAAEAIRRGALDDARSALERIAGAPELASERLRRAAATVADMIGAAPPPPDLTRLRRTLEAGIGGQWPGPRWVRAVALAGIVVSFATATVPTALNAYTVRRACLEADDHLPSALVATAGANVPIGESIAAIPEPGSVEWAATPLDLDAAAESRHDPDTRDQLVEHGFVRGYQRLILAADRRGIQIDAFEFETRQGALQYQDRVTRYACRFANLAFGHPSGGVGLQVRYATGDPIVEQISWVTGTRRIVVSISLLEVPRDHERIIAIASQYR
jgi:hypothetical protein